MLTSAERILKEVAIHVVEKEKEDRDQFGKCYMFLLVYVFIMLQIE